MTRSLSELARVFGRIGCLSFGGPAAQIALMHRELVEQRGWLSESEYLRGLSFCMLLPGPEAMQLATYAGWKQRGLLGGLIAGGLFVGPGALVIFALAFGYAALGDAPWVQAVFLGIKAAVLAVVAEAILRVAKKALKRRSHWVIAGLAFTALYAFALPFPLVIALAALWGFMTTAPGADAPRDRFDGRRAATIIAVGCALWAMPVLAAWLAGQTFLTDLGLFFSKLAVVTFGGAYAVLSYMTQEVVQSYGWLTTGQMMDALGLAETTPGPLILVTQFVGVVAGSELGGWHQGLLGGLMVLWVTFVPCFIWIFAGAPLIDWLAGRPRLSGALQAITAAVVGVIANLSLWFALHVLFGQVFIWNSAPVSMALPVPGTLNLAALALTVLAGWALLWRHWPFPAVLALSGTLGLMTLALPG